jgi:hypothetical protein
MGSKAGLLWPWTALRFRRCEMCVCYGASRAPETGVFPIELKKGPQSIGELAEGRMSQSALPARLELRVWQLVATSAGGWS